MCVEISTEGVITRFATLIRKNIATVSGWYRGEVKIPLSDLLRICYCMDLSVIDFLNGPDAVRKCGINVRELPNVAHVVRNRRTPKPFDRKKAEIELTNFLDVVPPVSLAEAARRMEGDRRYLFLLFPELCRKVSSRYKNYLQDFYRTERSKLEDEIRQAVIYLYPQGIYVSPRLVAEYLNKPTYLGRRDVAAITRETREQLDSEGKAR